jgi:hypothetical protein
MIRLRKILSIGLVAGMGVGAAAAPEKQPPNVYPAAQAPAHLQPIVRHADLIIVTLQSALLSELHRRLDDVSPAEALDACHLAAIPVEQRAGRYEGVAVGRTSARLRNPANTPPPWASPIVERYADQPRANVDGFVVDLGDRVGVLRPIREQPICASCHGPEQILSPGVSARLAKRYPEDRAVGFHDGDIRGWFWVEVPGTRRP